jgi:hypothetical protein
LRRERSSISVASSKASATPAWAKCRGAGPTNLPTDAAARRAHALPRRRTSAPEQTFDGFCRKQTASWSRAGGANDRADRADSPHCDRADRWAGPLDLWAQSSYSASCRGPCPCRPAFCRRLVFGGPDATCPPGFSSPPPARRMPRASPCLCSRHWVKGLFPWCGASGRNLVKLGRNFLIG